MMTGVLNVNKPSSWTSHDVVKKVRRITGQSRVGHTGTLDPLATGVLLVCLGTATRISPFLSNLDKTYLATLTLGKITDTWDADGRVLETRPVQVTEREIRETLPLFVGEVQQVPPMYSAVKQDGVRLYQLARAGHVVERARRTVHIFGIDMVRFQGEDLILRVRCSKGTYIRSLAADVGNHLGCGAHISALRREQVDSFSVDRSLELGEIERLVRNHELSRHLISMNNALRHLPEIKIEKDKLTRIQHGTAVSISDSTLSDRCYRAREPVRLVGEGNRLLGLGTIEPDRSQSAVSVQPIRVFS